MTAPQTISIPVSPVAKPRMTRQDKWMQRPRVVKYRKYCTDLVAAMPNYQLPGELTLTFLMPMPASWSKRKRTASLGAPHTTTPDVDNLAKGFMDAFRSDDAHVYALHAEKYWADAGSIELELAP